MALYLIKEGEKVGPLSLSEIKRRLVRREITEEDKAYVDALETECLVREIPGVFGREHRLQLTEQIGLHPNSYEDIHGYYDVDYVGFFRRLLAATIDLAILSSPPLALLLAADARGSASQSWTSWALLSLAILAALYFPLLEASRWRGTLGKKLLGVWVTDLDGETLTLAAALGRNLAKLLSLGTLGLGFAMVLFTARSQSLHDLVAKTIVIKDDGL